jgi:MFS family permease
VDTLRPVRSLLDVIAPPRLGSTFRWLLASNWVSNLGDGFSMAAGPLLVASQSHSPVLVSLGALMQWVPGFVLGLWAGAVADRVDRRALILQMNFLRAGALAALTATILAHAVNVWIVLIALLLLGTADTFANSASGAVLPMLVEKRDLGIANARFTFGWVGLSQLTGPPVGAALFAIGAAWSFGSETACALAGVLLFTRVVLPPHGRAPADRRHLRHEILEGLQWTRRSPAMRALVIQILTFNITYGASWSVLVLFSQQRLHLGTVGFGLLTTVTALGSLLGTMTYGWLARHVSLGSIMRYGLVLETLTHGVLAATTRPAVAMVILFLFGIHLAYWATTAMSVRQRAVPLELQGRVGSVYTMALMGGLVVGAGLGGLLASTWGITAPYWFGFFGCAVILAAIWREIGNVAHEDAKIIEAS